MKKIAFLFASCLLMSNAFADDAAKQAECNALGEKVAAASLAGQPAEVAKIAKSTIVQEISKACLAGMPKEVVDCLSKTKTLADVEACEKVLPQASTGPNDATKEDCETIAKYSIKIGLLDSGMTYEQFMALPAGPEAIKMAMDECVGKVSHADAQRINDCFKAAGDNPTALKACIH